MQHLMQPHAHRRADLVCGVPPPGGWLVTYQLDSQGEAFYTQFAVSLFCLLIPASLLGLSSTLCPARPSGLRIRNPTRGFSPIVLSRSHFGKIPLPGCLEGDFASIYWRGNHSATAVHDDRQVQVDARDGDGDGDLIRSGQPAVVGGRGGDGVHARRQVGP